MSRSLLALAALLLASVPASAQTSRPVSAAVQARLQAPVVAPRTSPDQARALGRSVYDRPTPDNSVVLLVDHQVGLMSGVRDFTSLSEYKNNVLALAETAKAFGIPVLLTTSNAQWQNGDLLPELKTLFPDQEIIRRYGIINAYEDPAFRAALEATGRTHVLIAGVTLGTCTAFPTLSMLQDGYQVFPVIDASGAWSRYESEAAIQRMSTAGAQPVTVFPLLAELQYDWRRPTANAAGAVFNRHLPEYGLTMDNFWNTAANAVQDPFGLVEQTRAQADAARSETSAATPRR